MEIRNKIQPSRCPIVPSNPPSNRSNTLAPNNTGKSKRNVFFCTVNGQMTDAIPKISKIFVMLLPTMFPMAMSALPCREEMSDVASSGALVPNDTIVKPIISCGTCNFFAIPAAPSTNQSAPFTKPTKPTKSSTIAIKISILFTSFRYGMLPVLYCTQKARSLFREISATVLHILYHNRFLLSIFSVEFFPFFRLTKPKKHLIIV